MSKKYSIEQLRQVKGVGEKTIQRIIEQFDESEYISKYDPNIHIEHNSLVHGDMLEQMNGIPDESVDMILTDLPYGTTACSWDSIIPFDKMWKQYERVIKNEGAIVLFGSQPFTTKLINSKIDMFKYEWVWKKGNVTGFAQANHRPMKRHENIVVFSKSATSAGNNNIKSNYFPIGLKRVDINKTNGNNKGKVIHEAKIGENGAFNSDKKYKQKYTGYPQSILEIDYILENGYHPTQKPTGILEYLIKTYTKEGDLVLDSTMGSGSTCVAAKNTGRKYIGIELDKNYFEIAKERIKNVS